MKNTTRRSGFTIIELLIVIVVIGILAAITLVSYNGVQNRAMTARSVSTANEVRTKVTVWNVFYSSYPDLAQLRTNSLSPTDIDTAGGAVGPPESKLSKPGVAIGAELNEERADSGGTVYYEPCWDGTKLSGGTVIYWDFGSDASVELPVGECP